MTPNRTSYRSNNPLSNDEIMAIAPSAFATQPWHATSSRYAFVPTSVIIDGMRNAGFFPYSVAQSRSRIAGKSEFTKHMIRFRPQNATLTAVGDSILEAVLINSHDGTSVYDLSAGVFRLACLNGMMVAEGSAGLEPIRVRHTGRILDAVIEGTQRILEAAPAVNGIITEWKSIQLNRDEQRILAEEALSLRFDRNEETGNLTNSVTPEQILKVRRNEDAGDNLWNTFNRIQEATVSGGLRSYSANGRRQRTKPVVGIAENSKLNRALWSLAEKMAALKTA